MDKIGVKIGLNRHPRAIVILCEILRQACKSYEIRGIRVRVLFVEGGVMVVGQLVDCKIFCKFVG